MDPEQQDQRPQDQLHQNQPQQGQPPYEQRPPDRRRDEKQDEKQGEKEREKKQEKGQGMDEKYRRNPVGFVAWALVIIWFGVTMLLQNLDVFGMDNEDLQWAVFFWGGGAIFLAAAILRLLIPQWRRPVVGSLIWGAVWVAVGFGFWKGWEDNIWEIIVPIVIIAVGVGILVSRLTPRR